MKHFAGETEPAAAGELFGSHIDTAREFHEHLVRYGEELGLVGPRELERLWTRHIVNSALVATLVKGQSLADVGSGAGFPGLVIAIARPDLACCLIEPMDRRARWLREEADRLGLTNVEVLRSRAEDVPASRTFDVVTARAVSALKKLIPLTVPLLVPGGELLFLKGARLEQEIIEAKAVLERYGIVDFDTVTLGPQWNTEETRVFRATVGSNKP